MKKIFVSAGHSSVTGKGRDNGAVGNSYTEGVEADKLRDIVVNELKKLGASVTSDGDDTILADTLKEFRKTATQDSIVVEIHLNAATPKATGTETLVPNNPTSSERALAETLSKIVGDTLGIPLRGSKGVKTESESARGSLGWMRLPGDNILMEIAFISNKDDMQKLTSNRDILGKRIAQALFEAAGGKKEGEVECFYTVVKGDTLSAIAVKENTSVSKLMKDNNLSSTVIQIGQKLKL